MAFANRIGSLLKKSTASCPSLYQAIRSMSSSKVFVGGLSYGTDDQSLREAFMSFGEVVEARVILDRESGRSRGFGFVTFTSSEEASSAISGLDGKDLHGRMIRVNYATDRTGGFRGGYGGGGYGGGSGGYGDGNNRPTGGGGSYSYGGGGSGYGGGGGISRSGGGNDNYTSGFGGGYGGASNSGGNFSVTANGGNNANYDINAGALGGSGYRGSGSNVSGNDGGYGNKNHDDDVEDDFKDDDDDEPHDYANKRGC